MKVEILEVAREFLLGPVRERANEMDLDEEVLGWGLAGLAERGLMALRRPARYGGPDLGEEDFRGFQEMVARSSGSLAFLQTQHQSAVSMIAKGDNEDLKARILPEADRRLMGIGFSQLRRDGPPLFRAEEDGSGGYVVEGHLPWVTGAGFFGEVLAGAALADGRSVFGLLPFRDVDKDGGAIRYSEPMRLAAMGAGRTVTADVVAWRLGAEDVAFVKPAGWIQGNDMINVTLQSWFALGCARAGLDVVWHAWEARGAEFVREAWSALDAELEACRARASSGGLSEGEKLATRAWAIDLAARCSHAGVAASSGAANSLAHDAQRVYREALVYTVSAQTGTIMEATLRRLVGRGQVESGA